MDPQKYTPYQTPPDPSETQIKLPSQYLNVRHTPLLCRNNSAASLIRTSWSSIVTLLLFASFPHCFQIPPPADPGCRSHGNVIHPLRQILRDANVRGLEFAHIASAADASSITRGFGGSQDWWRVGNSVDVRKRVDRDVSSSANSVRSVSRRHFILSGDVFGLPLRFYWSLWRCLL